MSCSQWRKCTLGDLVKFQRGHDLSKTKMSGDGYIVAGSNGIIGYHNEYTTEGPCITIGRSGNVGTPYFYNEKCWAHNTTLYIKEFYEVDPKYIYYYLKTLNLGHYAGGSAVPTLNRNHIHPIEVNVPSSIKEQNRIANILTSLDNKIELNNEMNKTLEEMAQALFKRWFVDFEFPDENGKPYKSSGGKMVESELGMVPKGWEIKLISEVVEIRDGTHASPKPKEEGYPLITSKHINGDKIDFKSANLISKEDYDEVNKRSKVDTGDILISMIGTVGLIHLIQEKEINFAIKNIGLFKTSQKDVISEYLYLFLKSNDMKNYIEARLAGTTQKYISLGELRKIKFVLPSDDVINEFKLVIENIFNKKRKNIEVNDSIIELRDSLLPKLMSGEIRVEDIEASR